MSAPTPFRPTPSLPQGLSYTPPQSFGEIVLKLDTNEGPFIDEIRNIFGSLSPETVRRYPHREDLEHCLAEQLQISPQQILVTPGGDDALDRICRAYLSPGDEVVCTKPTFEMLGYYVSLTGATCVTVDWYEGEYPRQKILSSISQKTRIIAIVSPNNPTGLAVSEEDLRIISQTAPHALLLADFAYEEFADEPLTGVALSLPNVLIVRTLSKAWGLAGARVGYVLGPAEGIAPVRATSGPYMVSSLSLAVAQQCIVSLRHQENRYVAAVKKERDILAELLARRGLNTLRSQANFVFARHPRADFLYRALQCQGISIRSFGARPDLSDALRITCPGNHKDFQRLQHAIENSFSPECLLFDMDGVLADVRNSYRKAIIDTANSFGVSIQQSDIEAMKARGNANNDWILTWELIKQAGKLEVNYSDVQLRFEMLYQGTDSTAGYRDLEELLVPTNALRHLAKHRKLGLVTGRPRKDAVHFLQRFDIEACFPVMVCHEDAPSKPDPAGIRFALHQLGCSSGWMIGDTPDDSRAAVRAGVVALGVFAPGADESVLGPALLQSGAAAVFSTTIAALNILGE